MTIPAAEQSLSGYSGHLNESQQKALDHFRAEVERELGSDPADQWYDDITLLCVFLSESRKGSIFFTFHLTLRALPLSFSLLQTIFTSSKLQCTGSVETIHDD